MNIELNDKEVRTLEALATGKTMTLAEIVVACGWTSLRSGGSLLTGKSRGNSWVRNSLRKLRDHKLVIHVGPGKYRISARGMKVLVNG